MEQFIEMINKGICESINEEGISDFTLFLTTHFQDLRDLLEFSTRTYKNFEKHLNRERKIEFLLFIKTVNEKILEEVRTVKVVE